MPETDPRFPAGAWTGFYLQYWLPGRHPTHLVLSWAGGTLTGSGADRPGAYTVSGTYDPATGRCAWTKQYVGKHAVSYRGVADGSGVWGVWEIRLFGGLYHDRGGFHIWPEGAGAAAEAANTEQAVQALMEEEFGGRVARAVRAALTVGVLAALAAAAWWASGVLIPGGAGWCPARPTEDSSWVSYQPGFSGAGGARAWPAASIAFASPA